MIADPTKVLKYCKDRLYCGVCKITMKMCPYKDDSIDPASGDSATVHVGDTYSSGPSHIGSDSITMKDYPKTYIIGIHSC